MLLDIVHLGVVVGVFYLLYLFLSWLKSKSRMIFRAILKVFFPKWAHRLWATENWLNASRAYSDWIENHPLESDSHPEAQKLLRIMVGAYILFLDAHPEIDGTAYLNYLIDEMEDWVL